MKRSAAAWWLASALAVGGCSGGTEAPKAPAQSAFQAIEAELLGPRCASGGCHGSSAAGGLDLSPGKAHGALVGVAAQRRPDKPLVAPGNPDGSYLWERLTPGGDTPLMPLGSPALGEADLARLREWIQAGAKP